MAFSNRAVHNFVHKPLCILHFVAEIACIAFFLVLVFLSKDPFHEFFINPDYLLRFVLLLGIAPQECMLSESLYKGKSCKTGARWVTQLLFI